MLALPNPAARQRRCVAWSMLGVMAGIVFLCITPLLSPGWDAPLALSAGIPRALVISLIVFGAATVSSIVGFAFSPIAAAMLLHEVPDAVEAVQIMMIASIGIQAYCVAELGQSIRWTRVMPFLVGGVAALPFGVYLLMSLPSRVYLLTIGAALIAYGLTMLFRRAAVARGGSRPLVDGLIGALGGIGGPLAASPGAFVALWCARRDWSKVEQRAVYQPYILIMQILGLAALIALKPSGPFDPRLLGFVVPGLAGAVIGFQIFRALGEIHFQRMINLALIASGAALLLK